MSDPVDSPVGNPYVPLVVPPDSARDARVAARRAADARRAGRALDQLLTERFGPAEPSWAGAALDALLSERYGRSLTAHNGHYGVVERDCDLAESDCLKMDPSADCPAAGSPRCRSCEWRPA